VLRLLVHQVPEVVEHQCVRVFYQLLDFAPVFVDFAAEGVLGRGNGVEGVLFAHLDFAVE